MKLSNLSVIFIVVAIPLILLLSYYISLQRDTINLQTSYNTKLLESTKEAIEAFEINTVEWNEAYSETEDSKRRDIMAAINTFTTSLANNLGVSGTSKEFLLANIPAVAFTLYDGCYIYTPSEVKKTITDENGVTVRMSQNLIDVGLVINYNESNIDIDKGKILFKVSNDGDSDGRYNGEYFTLDSSKADIREDKHVLKPFTPYTETVESSSGDEWIISYTLDNYITAYGEKADKYTSESGYLNITSATPDNRDNVIYINNNNFTNKSINGITFSGQEVGPEILTETIVYKDGAGTLHTEKFNYVYESQKDTKVYYDGKFFRLNNDLEKVYIEDLTEPLYKKCTVPAIIGGEQKYIKVYQSLVANPSGSYTWYVKNDYNDIYTPRDISAWHSSFSNPLYDYSAINYCVETFVFTNWINSLGLEENLTINIDNDPEFEYSKFNEHKKEIIRSVIESNLNQAITSYSRTRVEEYRLPMLKETEWDQVLSNVSIITFLQNIPIGLKYYNNYAIATSTLNKEYVIPDEIYIYNQNTSSDLIYHSPYCDKLTDISNLIGYRSIDYIYKYYEDENEDTTKYYFRHTDETGTRPVTQSCYYCLIQRALYKADITNEKKDAYYTALARERYIQLDEPIVGEETVEIDVGKQVDNTTKRYGDNIEYKITVTNNGTNDKVITIEDDFDNVNVNLIMENLTVNEGTLTVDGKRIIVSDITLPVGETKEIIIQGKVIGNVGRHTNIAKAWVDGQEFISNSVTVTVVKDIKIVARSVMQPTNIVFIIDSSGSMIGTKIRAVEKAVKDFVQKMDLNDDKSLIGFVKFYTTPILPVPLTQVKGPYRINQRETLKNALDTGINAMFASWTQFSEGLEKGNDLLKEMQEKNPENRDVVIFLSDGMPTDIYTSAANALKNNSDIVYAIGFGSSADIFKALRENIADEGNFKSSEDMDAVFAEIYNEITTSIDTTIDGSIFTESTGLISGTEADLLNGKWISLENDSEYDFSIDSDEKMNGIDIATTIIKIQVDGSTIKEDTLFNLSREGYIGKANGYVYLNLSKFESYPSAQITIEVVK